MRNFLLLIFIAGCAAPTIISGKNWQCTYPNGLTKEDAQEVIEAHQEILANQSIRADGLYGYDVTAVKVNAN